MLSWAVHDIAHNLGLIFLFEARDTSNTGLRRNVGQGAKGLSNVPIPALARAGIRTFKVTFP